MGNSTSEPSVLETANQVGYRILGIQNDSPASVCNFAIYFDFIVAANNIALTSLDSTFVDIIQVMY